MKKIKRRSDCPISYALDIFGDKWTLLIIRDLMFEGKRTYGEFLNSDEKIATNILADRLETLQCAGLIKSETDKQKKSRIIYSLTHKGIDLVPVLLEIVKWSAKYDLKTGAPKQFVEKIKNDKENLMNEITAGLKGENKFYVRSQKTNK
ncbi:MAG: helix-turn-helix transcriptional regulator [Chlorobi bacterium]|nr:helix-turn-helix transcriptional regulator [Chlorobiota bacterium]MCI0715629.1 helix-turn-helix transcriptional regulator [Chlorobiota bacterium]